MKKLAGVSGRISRIQNFLTVSVVASLMALLASNAAYAIEANALPQGGNVVGGSASFSHPTSNSLNVKQHSERTVINWDSFNIGQNASVQFQQPDAKALAVNRVINSSADPTQILGNLSSNGQVMVLDKNGVLFGNSAVVNVGGITASTGHVS
jgi:filamentous hemagglutinin family protein